MRFYASLLVSILAVSVCFAMAAPKPSAVQFPQEWTLDVQYQPLQQITLRSGDNGKTVRYWYLILTVTNNTGQDVEFYPECEMMTDTFEIIPAGKSVPPEVFEEIKRMYQNMYPFLEPLDTSGMRILQGQDNTRDIAIIWPDFDIKAKEVSIFIGGLSNETAVLEYPATEEGGEPTKVFLRKTLELDYKFSGDPAFRSNPNMTFAGASWVMR